MDAYRCKFQFNIIVLIALAALVTFGSCSQNDAADAREFDEHNTNGHYAGDEYGLERFTYPEIEGSEITLNIPVFNGMKDTTKQDALNKIVRARFWRSLYERTGEISIEKDHLNVDYYLMYNDAHYVSILFVGDSYVAGAAYPSGCCFTLNLDVDAAGEIPRTKFNFDKDRIMAALRDGTITVLSPELEDGYDAIREMDKKELIDDVADADVFFSDSGIRFVIPVAHAVGDNLIVGLSYSDSKKKNVSDFDPFDPTVRHPASNNDSNNDANNTDSMSTEEAITTPAIEIDNGDESAMAKLYGKWRITKRAGTPRVVYSSQEMKDTDMLLIGSEVEIFDEYYIDTQNIIPSPRYSIDAIKDIEPDFLDYYAYINEYGYDGDEFDRYYPDRDLSTSPPAILNVFYDSTSSISFLLVDEDTMILLDGYVYELQKVE